MPGGDLLHDGVDRGVEVDDQVGAQNIVKAVVDHAVVEVTGCKMNVYQAIEKSTSLNVVQLIHRQKWVGIS